MQEGKEGRISSVVPRRLWIKKRAVLLSFTTLRDYLTPIQCYEYARDKNSRNVASNSSCSHP